MTQTDYNEIRSTNVAKVEVEEKVTVEAPENERVPKKAVVKGSTVEERKPGLMTRLVRGILGPNGIRAIGSYLGKEVIMPAIKDTLVNTINTGVNMAAYGEDRSQILLDITAVLATRHIPTTLVHTITITLRRRQLTRLHELRISYCSHGMMLRQF